MNICFGFWFNSLFYVDSCRSSKCAWQGFVIHLFLLMYIFLHNRFDVTLNNWWRFMSYIFHHIQVNYFAFSSCLILPKEIIFNIFLFCLLFLFKMSFVQPNVSHVFIELLQYFLCLTILENNKVLSTPLCFVLLCMEQFGFMVHLHFWTCSRWYYLCFIIAWHFAKTLGILKFWFDSKCW